MVKITVLSKRDIEVKYLQVSAGVRYWESASVNGLEDSKGDLIPCREGDYWEPIIDLESGKILNWKQGNTADIHYKVCDDGCYALQNDKGEKIKEINGYVPGIMCPEENGYGDYIIMKVDSDGKILNWKIKLDEFQDDYEQ